MTPNEIDRLLAARYGAEEAEDIEAIEQTLTFDVEHEDDGERPLYGRHQVGEFYRRFFASVSGHRFVPIRREYEPERAVDESIVEAVAVGDAFGYPGRGRLIRFRLLREFEFQAGRIRRERVRLDRSEIAAQLAVD